MIFNRPLLAVLPAFAAITLGVGACTDAVPQQSGQRARADDRPRIAAAFYPLHYLTERIVGGHVEVIDLSEHAAEPHDLKLGPRDVGTVVEADLTIYLRGFQPSVDEAVDQGDNGMDVGSVAELAPLSDHRTERSTDDGDPDRAQSDLHFWLDPERYADVAREIGERLGDLDPEHARSYDRATTDLVDDLHELDRRYRRTLTDCRSDDLVVAHEAFGYLADRYGLRQHGVSAADPHAEPPPRQLADLVDVVRREHVTTVYHEPASSGVTARTIADETGVDVAALDPVESLTDESDGDDYFAVMRSNLTTLADGQECDR